MTEASEVVVGTSGKASPNWEGKTPRRLNEGSGKLEGPISPTDYRKENLSEEIGSPMESSSEERSPRLQKER